MTKKVETELKQGRNPWDRLDGEGDAPFSMFRAYLETPPPRDLKALAATLRKSPATTKKYSADYAWAARAAAWDAEQVKAEDEAILDERGNLAREHLRAWKRVREIALKHLELMVDNDGNAIPGVAKARDVATLLDRATHHERLISGDATERVESRTAIDTSKLSTDELVALRHLLRKARGE
jgi:hypothetical protein